MTKEEAKQILEWHAKYGSIKSIVTDHEFMKALKIYMAVED